MKVSFITTVFNEATNINLLIDSILSQSRLPDEIIIVDGGSSDKTFSIINERIKKDKLHIKLLIKKGNRSVGRNEAIRQATGNVLVCTDAGNVLDRNWIKNIVSPFADEKIDVVAGYYDSKAKNIFQRCLIPYVLVMPDNVNPNEFLPATRSMAFKKSVWEKVGRFDEKLSHNEDYAFAKKIKKEGFKIVFAKDAVVYWTPPSGFKKAFIMFLRFAYGDAEAGFYRPKALLVILRYFVGLLILGFSIYTHSLFLTVFIYMVIFNYILWSVLKNYYYVKNMRAIILLPLIQIVSDFAVILGTISGAIKYGIQ